MPTYGYECSTCKHSFEAFQKITAEPLESCPKCGNAVRRLIGGGVGIIFKGSGFYTTDYKRSSAGGNGSSGKDSSSSDSSAKDSSSASSSSKEGPSKDTSSKDASSTSSDGKKD